MQKHDDRNCQISDNGCPSPLGAPTNGQLNDGNDKQCRDVKEYISEIKGRKFIVEDHGARNDLDEGVVKKLLRPEDKPPNRKYQ